MPTAPQRAKGADGTTDTLAAGTLIQLEQYEPDAAERKCLDLTG